MGARSTHVISCPAMPACYWLIRIKRRSAWPVVSSWGCFSQENQSTRSHCSHRAESAGLQQCRIKVVGFTVFNTELSTTREYTEYTEYIELSTTREASTCCTVLTSDGGGAAVNMWRIRVDQWTTHLSINFSNKYSYRILRENMFLIILMNYNLTFSSLLASSLYVHSTFDMR